MSVTTYPVHVDASLDPRLNRWLWLVKWLLAVPHYIVLAFLWVGFAGVSVIAFFAILLTGRYPRVLFDFNVGVLRWTWRVAYYTYGALATDRYPPFSLAEDPTYPAHLEIDYPHRLSRGLVLVKWWLLAIPHYLVVGVFVGGGWALWRTREAAGGAIGLIDLLVLVAAVVLAFTGRYPQQIFDFVLGMNRWALRVAAYAGLMTDRYPPFRLDMGGHEAGTVTMSKPAAAPTVEPAPPGEHRRPRGGWTGGRVTSLVAGILMGILALGIVGAGGVAAWATSTQRGAGGYISSDRHTFRTDGYAVTSDRIDLGNAGDAVTPGDVLGTVRIRVRGIDATDDVFVGIAPKADADRYLRGVSHLVVTGWDGSDRTRSGSGRAPAVRPSEAGIWSASAKGTGPQTLTWTPSGGDWTVVVMNADGRPGLGVSADVGATVPDLALIATVLLVGGGVLLAVAVPLVAVAALRASRR
ncbi:DUF4389 domain-containing protein [Jatrophihabitans fulvus]